MDFSEIFGEAKQFYDQLTPQQRQAVVQQFQQHFGNSGDPQLQQQAQSLDPNNPDPQQLGQMHDYAQQNDPAALNRAMDHPQIQEAMSQQGVTGWDGGQYQGQQGGGYPDQGGFGDRGAYQQDMGGGQGQYQQGQYQQGDYPDQGDQRPFPGQDEGYQQGGQYGQGDPYRQDEGGY